MGHSKNNPKYFSQYIELLLVSDSVSDHKKDILNNVKNEALNDFKKSAGSHAKSFLENTTDINQLVFKGSHISLYSGSGAEVDIVEYDNIPAISKYNDAIHDMAKEYGISETLSESTETTSNNDYQKIGGHTAPTFEDVKEGAAALLSDVSDFYPDFYDMSNEKLANYYPGVSVEDYQLIKNAQDNPDAEVKIYRAVPESVQEINPNDWVTNSREYAENHGKDNLRSAYHVLEATVKAGDLATEGNSVAEWSYVGQQTLTPKLDLYEDITEALNDDDFQDRLGASLSGENPSEDLKRALSDHCDIEITAEISEGYAKHMLSENIAKLADDQEISERDVQAIRASRDLVGEDAFRKISMSSAVDKKAEELLNKTILSRPDETVSEKKQPHLNPEDTVRNQYRELKRGSDSKKEASSNKEETPNNKTEKKEEGGINQSMQI